MDKKVSVIVNCHNGEKYLVKCISSILNQTYQNFEIIIVDDISFEWTKSVVEKLTEKDLRIKDFL